MCPMRFCVLGGCTSLREIYMGLAAFEGKLNHIGLTEAPPRSTLADANKNRPSEVFQNIFAHLSNFIPTIFVGQHTATRRAV